MGRPWRRDSKYHGGVSGRASALAAFWILLGGCVQVVPLPVEIPDGEAPQILFTITRREEGRLARLSAPFGVEAGRTTFGEAPALVLLEGEVDALLVAIRVEHLAVGLPGFEPSRLAEVRVEIAPPPAQPVRRAEGLVPRVTMAVRLPPETSVLRIAPEGGREALAADHPGRTAVLEHLTLVLPEDPERCRNPVARPLTAYAGAPNAVGPLVNHDWGAMRLNRAGRVDDDRVVVAGVLALYVVERGQVVSDPGPGRPRRHFFHWELVQPSSRAIIEAVAVDPIADPDGTRGVLVVGRWSSLEAPEVDRGFAVELPLGPEGFEEVRPSLLTDATPLRGAAIDPEGRAVIVGDGSILFERTRGGVWRQRALPPLASSERDVGRRVAATGDPRRPFVASTRARLHVYDAARDDWSSDFITGIEDDFQAYGLAGGVEGGELDLWAGSTRGRLFRRGPREWQPVNLSPPPRYHPCDPNGAPTQPELTRRVEGLAMGGGYLYAVVDRCTGVLVVRLADLCASLLTIEGEEAQVRNPGFEDVHLSGGELLVVGEAGQVWSTTVGE